MNQMPKLVECPRDAMQGLADFIPTQTKINYLNALLKVGFDTLDFGSFVSPKAIPQMADTAQVLEGLDWESSKTKLLAIVANERGAEDACRFDGVKFLGFPFSISETFQLRNTNKTIVQALESLSAIQELAVRNNKEVVAYISMGFGNPYGDPYSPDLVGEYSSKLRDMGISIISIADTVGSSRVEDIQSLFPPLLSSYSDIEFGAHLHSRPQDSLDKALAVIVLGLQRLDSAMMGFGGCPMAKDDLTGNMATEIVLQALEQNGIASGLDMEAFSYARQLATGVFPLTH
jgi:hydroxymethylglutaryl-CoA lyase